ncbi:MAG: hypothetical protein R6V01_05490 [Thermoplasmatota archaeon]
MSDVDDIFGDFKMPEEGLATGPPPISGDASAGAPPQHGPRNNRPVEDELKELESSISREKMTERYSRVPRSRGETVAKVGGPLGIGAVVIALFFMGSFLVDLAILNTGMLTLVGLFSLPLGGLLSLGALVLGIVALVLGAGEYRSKAIFAIIFSILYWVMVGAFWLLLILVISYDISGA